MKKYIRLFRIALEFLTPLPLGPKGELSEPELAHSMRLYPLVGLIIGLALLLIKTSAYAVGLSDLVTGVLLALALTALSGGIHLDGLSDMCDGFYGGRTKEDILRIMRDPHIGVMGATGIVFVLMLKIAIIASLIRDPFAIRLIIITPVLSRWAMALATAIGPYPTIDPAINADYKGIGQAFVNNISKRDWQIATIIAVALAAILFYAGGVLLCVIVPIVVIILVLYARKVIGGVTGDILGAVNEIIEVVVLLMGYMLLLTRP
jgi:adenosylcobinamide-GDP ribazoletransferase